MNMREHILAALREQFESWETLLADLDEAHITAPRFDLGWSIKDVMAHLWAWQQISIARTEAGALDREPEYPAWFGEPKEAEEENADRVNARIYALCHAKAWPEIHGDWQAGFRRFLDLGSALPERDLLDGDRYTWLKGYSLADILVASYAHHQEHLDKLRTALRTA